MRHYGWHWWLGVGNDRQADGKRPTAEKWWVVLCWSQCGTGYASSACWVEPMNQATMGGRWGNELVPDKIVQPDGDSTRSGPQNPKVGDRYTCKQMTVEVARVTDESVTYTGGGITKTESRDVFARLALNSVKHGASFFPATTKNTEPEGGA